MVVTSSLNFKKRNVIIGDLLCAYVTLLCVSLRNITISSSVSLPWVSLSLSLLQQQILSLFLFPPLPISGTVLCASVFFLPFFSYHLPSSSTGLLRAAFWSQRSACASRRVTSHACSDTRRSVNAMSAYAETRAWSREEGRG